MKKLVLVAITLTFACTYSARAQTNSRSIVLPTVDDPRGNLIADENGRYLSTDLKGLAIVSVSIEGEQVVFGQSFSASDEWLKSLEITVKNISDRPIKAIRMSFSLPETGPANLTGFSLEYGRELSTGIDYGEQKVIEPGEVVRLFRSERHYKRDSEGLARRTGISKFTQLILSRTQVKFEDDTIWMSQNLPILK